MHDCPLTDSHHEHRHSRPQPPALTAPRRLAGPHGIDRYLELVRPNLTVCDARAEVLAARHQTPRSVTLTVRPNAAWSGFRAGQFVRAGVEIAGVRRTRTYSPACSQHRADGSLELTVTVHPGGLVSKHLHSRLDRGTIVHLGSAAGDFVLPPVRPERLVLISGGSGVTPVLSMLRTLCDEGHDGEVAFLHYARTAADWLYKPEVDALAVLHPNIRVAYVATREGARQIDTGGQVEGGRHIDAEAVRELVGSGPDAAYAAVCGPPGLIEAVRAIWKAAPDRVLAESFTPSRPTVRGGAPQGTLRFLRSDRIAAIDGGTLLEQAEAAGLSPEFGCRMGICHTCTSRKAAGPVRNILTGEVSEEDDEDIRLCVSVPAGNVALEL